MSKLYYGNSFIINKKIMIGHNLSLYEPKWIHISIKFNSHIKLFKIVKLKFLFYYILFINGINLFINILMFNYIIIIISTNHKYL